MSKKIFIDAGHGGNDPGAVNGSRQEKADNLKFSLALAKKLQDNGFQVNQTRTTDVSASLEARTKAANSWKADLFISVHRNSFTNATANEQEVWIYQSVDQTTKNFANNIYNEIIKVYAQSKRGVKSGNLYVTRTTTMPAILLELGFISNVIDNQKHDEFFDQYVEAVVKGVCNGFNIIYKPSITPTPSGKLYRVQIGSFKEKPNAEKMLQEALNKGFSDAFVNESREGG